MQLGFTKEQLEERRSYLGSSDVNILMSGDEAKIVNLWKIKRGEAEYEDLSGVLPVQMGVWTEPFNRVWYAKNTGNPVVRDGEQLIDPDHEWRRHTLDGLVEIDAGEIVLYEAKHVNQFTNIDEQRVKYMAQCQRGMMLGDLQRAHLSVFLGTLKWEVEEIKADMAYQAEMMERELAFWSCVKSGVQPGAAAPVTPPSNGVVTKVMDMTGNNAWADSAVTWCENQDASKD